MNKKTKPTIYTIGHSNWPLEIFISKLIDNSIEVLIDVRTIPLSRYCPHFNKSALQDALAKQTIKYLWMGQNLGGRGVNVGFDDAIDELSAMVKRDIKVCVMCSEGDYKKCHRYISLTPAFKEHELLVTHIQYDNKKKPNSNK